MEPFLEINLYRELRDVARAMAVVRDDVLLEAREDRFVYLFIRFGFAAAFLAWVLACAAFPIFLGTIGWVVVLSIAAINLPLLVLIGRVGGIPVPSDDEPPNRLDRASGGLGRGEVILVVAFMTVAFPVVIRLGIPLLDSNLRRLRKSIRRAQAIVSDPRWPELRRLWESVERYNVVVRKSNGYGIPRMIALVGSRCQPETLALSAAYDAHATIASSLLERARDATYLRPLGKAAPSTFVSFVSFADRIDEFDRATGEIVDATTNLLCRIRELSKDRLA